MKSAIRIALIFACINLAALDAILYTVDRELRTFREAVCGPMDAGRVSGATAKWKNPGQESFIVIVNPYSTGSYSLLTLATERLSLNFYGCDANGHRYRVWRKRYEK